ncbi:polyketide synthase dehydratase domain-containing protein, partial [Streptomyces sp. NRRL F-525]|uniref:polyketide synthase dehydratase domain-containing protein n=1 Tax=Streptomyces sp. NRRL F-525 TaxID=1463861 RepID=UPI0018FE36AA
DLALHAGNQLDAPHVEELTLEAPLALPEQGTVLVQLVAAAPDKHGRRALTVHSRPSDEYTWTRHATGILTSESTIPVGPDSPAWPPAGATPVDATGLYAQLAAVGPEYGPVFQGLQAAWRDGDTLYADIALPEGTDTTGFGIHPALLDSALHLIALRAITQGAADQLGLPFAWNGVSLHVEGVTTVRVRLEPAGPDAVALTLTDPSGAVIATVAGLTLRQVTVEQLTAARGTTSDNDALFTTGWMPVSSEAAVPSTEGWVFLDDESPAGTRLAALQVATAAGAPIPQTVIAPVTATRGDDLAADAHTVTRQTLALLQDWLAGPVRPRRPR